MSKGITAEIDDFRFDETDVLEELQNDPVLKMMMDDLDENGDNFYQCSTCGGQGGWSTHEGIDTCGDCKGEGIIYE